MVVKALVELLMVLVLAVVLYFVLTDSSLLSSLGLGGFTLPSSLNLSSPGSLITFPAIGPQPNEVPQSEAISVALQAINKDRNVFGLPNVSYSNETSAQQHSQSMLANNYFSHWDPSGLKPYMRYTLSGGTGAVDENIGYIYNSGGINVTSAIKQMEYSLVYNDSICCNNGHRNNTLNPYHNQVSIGVAYNKTTIFLTEDFINNYVYWFYNTPSYNNNTLNLVGAIAGNYSLSQVEVSYDAPTHNLSRQELNSTGPYSYGQTVAGIGHKVGNSVYYFSTVTTINATNYTTEGNDFSISFNMQNLASSLGAGEYTIMVWLTNDTSANSGTCWTNSNGVPICHAFIGSTYTIFINSQGQQYYPSQI